MPCSGLDEAQGLPWLPRLIEKARRHEAGRAAGTDEMNGFLYGESDFIDAKLLAFLGLDDTTVSALARDTVSVDDVARAIVARSGRTTSECAAFGVKLRKSLFNFALTEADEGRMPDGPRARLLRFAYNRVVMPIFYAKFAADERKRQKKG